jgi:hypothetical protein
MGVRMSCSRRPLAGSGYVKPDNPALEVQNNCALAALMAAREEQDSALQGMWTSGDHKMETILPPPPPVYTIPPSDTCFEVDGHFYKVPDVERALELNKSFTELAEERAKEEAKWAAHWTDPSAIAVVSTHVSEPMISETKIESTDDTDTLPIIEITELS